MSTTTEPIPETTPAPTAADRAAARFRRFKKHFGLYTDAELAQRAETSPTAEFLVDGMIAPGSVNILVGDSGIGKSALVYQLALAVATGRPFLGQRTRAGKVVLVDYENSLWDSHRILRQQRKYLGLEYAPHTLMVKPMNEPAPGATLPELSRQYLHENVEEMIDQLAAELVIFDSLRSFNPAMETDNEAAADQLGQLRTIARGRGTAILLVHHVRKLGVRQTHQMHLEDNAPLDWLMRSAGARALINQTDARFAISTRRGNDDTLVLRGHLRTHGEIGPYLLARIWDDAGQPLAYRRFDATPDMLRNPEQEAAFAGLPESFSLGEARQRYGRQNHATICFLNKLIRIGLLQKTAHGQYRKSELHGNDRKSELHGNATFNPELSEQPVVSSVA